VSQIQQQIFKILLKKSVTIVLKRSQTEQIQKVQQKQQQTPSAPIQELISMHKNQRPITRGPQIALSRTKGMQTLRLGRA
jgi:hypothetical protein